MSLLSQLAVSTSKLCKAAEAGDFSTADRLLSRREAELEALRQAVKAQPLNRDELTQLERILSLGAEACRTLVARRETARAAIGDLEADRRRQASWALQDPRPPSHLDLSA